ncbi:methylated-DNA--[protein]-cysteine S-methyltransferase [Jatrophihabitans sp. YIM 134969]
MTPDASTRHAVLDTTLGPLTAVVDDVGLRGLYFPGHWTRPDPALWGEPVDADASDLLVALATQLDEYLAGSRREFDVPLHLVGPDFGQRVWASLLRVPYGETVTYGGLAADLGGTHARAVGRFVGGNPVSVLVPCHRVVGADGSLTGYAGGLDRKRRLLELEGALVTPPGLF